MSSAKAGSDGSSVDFLPTITDSALLSTPVIAEGIVTTADGNALPGTYVQLLAWPSGLDKLAKGDAVKLQPIAKTVTRSDGHYQLRAASAESVAPLARADGSVDLEVVADVNGTAQQVNFTKQVIRPFSEASFAVRSPTVINVRPKGYPFKASPARGANAANSPLISDREQNSGRVNTDPNFRIDKSCNSILIGSYGATLTHVGWSVNLGDVATNTFTYTQGAESTIGVAVSQDTDFVDYTIGGSITISSSGTESFAPEDDYRIIDYQTNFTFGEFLVTCVSTGGGGVGESSWYETRVTGYAGGAEPSVYTLSTDGWEYATDFYCAYQEAGSTFTKEDTNAQTFDEGASIGPIGIVVNATTGFSTVAAQKYVFKKAGDLCGAYGYPGGDGSTNNPGPGYLMSVRPDQLH